MQVLESATDAIDTFQFGTKAFTLNKLRQSLSRALVCRCVVFSVREWHENRAQILEDIQKTLSPELVIVRSSALGEDSMYTSMAGAYESVKNVDSTRVEDITNAIGRVIASYGEHSSMGNEVLIQPMIGDVSMSGVIFSHDLTSGAPYYVVNYDDQTGLTDTVTSGSIDTSRTLLIYRDKVGDLHSTRFRALLHSVQEIEAITGCSGLDIEFAVTNNEDIYIFQVRAMAVSQGWRKTITNDVAESLQAIREYLVKQFQPEPGIFGKASIFGEMPDWNPAEMIGAVPRPLAKSLYETLITNSAWAEARAQLGYRDLTGRPLMASLGGRVYIDVRKSFNSFLPAGLPDEIGDILVDAWLSILKAHPDRHDKVEFEVATTALSLTYEEDIAEVREALTLKQREIFRHHLLQLTDDIVTGKRGNSAIQYSRLSKLNDSRKACIRSAEKDDLSTVQELLHECIGNGTVPFAIMARRAFIAESFLRSIQQRKILSAERVMAFRNSVPTVLTEFLQALHCCQDSPQQAAHFMETYGHLRPGTYDILASRYDQHSELVEQHAQRAQQPAAADPIVFSLTHKETEAVKAALQENGFSFGTEQLFEFMREAIAGREYAKLIFTRNVSDALERIAAWGERHGLTREALSYLNLDQIMQHHKQDTDEIREILRAEMQSASAAYAVSQALKLPYLITELSDIYIVPMLKNRPNFVTSKRVHASVHYLSDHSFDTTYCAGRIVMIERADPGYDWIFLAPIAGLITQYGGANSHMAIRCAEMGIPAAIGCGEQLFEQMRKSGSVLLDCAAGLVFPVH